MKIRLILFLNILLVLTLQGCLDLRECPKDVVGKYKCSNDNNASNYLTLKSDGTFEHSYEKNDLVLIDKGTWNISDDNNCVLELSNWKTYNEDGADYSAYANGILFLGYEYLDMTPDGYNSNSFKKVDN